MSRLGSDRAVRATGDDAAVTKWLSSRLGYFKDPFLTHFLQKQPSRTRAPIINKGTYSRVVTMQNLATEFVVGCAGRHSDSCNEDSEHKGDCSHTNSTSPEREPAGLSATTTDITTTTTTTSSPTTTRSATSQQGIENSAPPTCHHCQIVSLGAGLDTLYWRLKSQGVSPCVYFEVDFPSVVQHKVKVLGDSAGLMQWVRAPPSCGLRVPTPAPQPTHTGSPPPADGPSGDGGAQGADTTERPRPPSTSQEPTELKSLGSIRTADTASDNSNHGSLPHWRDYRLVTADLRDVDAVSQGLVAAGLRRDLPTLVLSECALVYLSPAHSDALLRWLAAWVRGETETGSKGLTRIGGDNGGGGGGNGGGNGSKGVNDGGPSISHSVTPAPPSSPHWTHTCTSQLPAGVIYCAYEQVNPNDGFGRMMMRNLQQRGCPLLSLQAYPTIDSQSTRFTKLGWDRYAAWNMTQVYRWFLPTAHTRQADRLEWMDELEQWRLLQSHYMISLAAVQADDATPMSTPTLSNGTHTDESPTTRGTQPMDGTGVPGGKSGVSGECTSMADDSPPDTTAPPAGWPYRSFGLMQLARAPRAQYPQWLQPHMPAAPSRRASENQGRLAGSSGLGRVFAPSRQPPNMNWKAPHRRSEGLGPAGPNTGTRSYPPRKLGLGKSGFPSRTGPHGNRTTSASSTGVGGMGNMSVRRPSPQGSGTSGPTPPHPTADHTTPPPPQQGSAEQGPRRSRFAFGTDKKVPFWHTGGT